MSSQGPQAPTASTTAAVAPPENANDWVSPGNVLTNNGLETSITAGTYDLNDISFWLIVYGLGFTIPTDATIDGIEVFIEKRRSVGAAVDYRVQLYELGNGFYADGTGGQNKATATAWPTSATVVTYGSATDTWGVSPTPSMVNDGNFGLVLSVQATANNTDIFVDYIAMTIHYTEGPADDRRAIVSWLEFQIPDAGNAAPTAAFTAALAGPTVTFTDTSAAGSGAITEWGWDFGDLTSTVTTQNAVHTYTTDGTYTVTLTVEDANTLTDDVSSAVTIRHPRIYHRRAIGGML